MRATSIVVLTCLRQCALYMYFVINSCVIMFRIMQNILLCEGKADGGKAGEGGDKYTSIYNYHMCIHYIRYTSI